MAIDEKSLAYNLIVAVSMAAMLLGLYLLLNQQIFFLHGMYQGIMLRTEMGSDAWVQLLDDAFNLDFYLRLAGVVLIALLVGTITANLVQTKILIMSSLIALSVSVFLWWYFLRVFELHVWAVILQAVVFVLFSAFLYKRQQRKRQQSENASSKKH